MGDFASLTISSDQPMTSSLSPSHDSRLTHVDAPIHTPSSPEIPNIVSTHIPLPHPLILPHEHVIDMSDHVSFRDVAIHGRRRRDRVDHDAVIGLISPEEMG